VSDPGAKVRIMPQRRIAALFVETGGAYFDLPGVEPWDIVRDARLYPGPDPVVAHPPCERWGRYWHGGQSANERRLKGDDGGCFAAALAAVERWGGVLEHPEASHAFAHHGLGAPPRSGGWVATRRGWVCCVEQGHYGHRARKMTWLYMVGAAPPPELRWGKADTGAALPARSIESAVKRGVRLSRIGQVALMSRRQRAATPPAFRDLLIRIARAAAPAQLSLLQAS
jgi:hypothetical protein